MKTTLFFILVFCSTIFALNYELDIKDTLLEIEVISNKTNKAKIQAHKLISKELQKLKVRKANFVVDTATSRGYKVSVKLPFQTRLNQYEAITGINITTRTITVKVTSEYAAEMVAKRIVRQNTRFCGFNDYIVVEESLSSNTYNIVAEMVNPEIFQATSLRNYHDFYVAGQSNAGTSEKIIRFSTGKSHEELVDVNRYVTYFDIDHINQKIYWIDSDGAFCVIKRANFNMTELETIVSTEAESIYSVCVDAHNDILFWADDKAGISKCDLNGDNIKALGINSIIVDLKVDSENRKLYYANLTEIFSMNFNGSDVKSHYWNSEENIYEMEIDTKTGNVYFAQTTENSMGMTVTNIYRIDTNINVTRPIIEGIVDLEALEYDADQNFLYWCRDVLGQGYLIQKSGVKYNSPVETVFGLREMFEVHDLQIKHDLQVK